MACLEYADGVPDAFKNLLDWLASTLKCPRKPVALLNTTGRASLHAQAALREVLITMSAHLTLAACITVPPVGRRLRTCRRAC